MSPPQQTLQRTGTQGIAPHEMSMSLITARQPQRSTPLALRVWLEENVPIKEEVQTWAQKHRVNTAICVRVLAGIALLWFLVPLGYDLTLRWCAKLFLSGAAGSWHANTDARYGVAVFVWITSVASTLLGVHLAHKRAHQRSRPMTLGDLFLGASAGLMCGYAFDALVSCIFKQ